ncbi:MAG TPA: FAD-dependent oxidoreductase [Telluria sp.]|nr:FAD-dependent oxidoreductase [Telluria sp.]
MPACDVLVIGAGIVGAACAAALLDEGMSVIVVDAGQPGGGVTAAGMGHLVALDENPAELDLCLLSLERWNRFMNEHPAVGEPHRCGTLWVAEDAEQLAHAEARAERLCARGWSAELVRGAELARVEPMLRAGLAGALRVGGDGVIYPPAVAYHLIEEARQRGASVLTGRRVSALGPHSVLLEDGARLAAAHVVVAAGVEVARLLPDVPVFPRKGHLAITDRYAGALRHQVVSMAYGQPEGGADRLAVAANIQPRPTGQLLVGSCRQDGQDDTSVDLAVTGAVLRAAIGLLPALAGMRIVRTWAGLRPATPDGLPLIGAYPGQPDVWLAVGHEGLGVTTAFGTAQLVAAQIAGRACPIDAAPFAPARLMKQGRADAA